ncbi:helicase subunit [Enterobacter hormaechei]|nr:helicase subunit [Enterobacter hormaechei]
MKKVTSKHNVLQEEDGVQGKRMINLGPRMVMN